MLQKPYLRSLHDGGIQLSVKNCFAILNCYVENGHGFLQRSTFQNLDLLGRNYMLVNLGL